MFTMYTVYCDIQCLITKNCKKKSYHLPFSVFTLSATPHNPAPQNTKVNKHVGTAYPSLPPGYQNASPPGGPRMQYPGGPQQFPQVNPSQFYSYVISRFHKGFVDLVEVVLP